MKQFKLTFLLTVLMSMVGVKALAYDIAVENSDGIIIYYNWINNNTELSVRNHDEFNFGGYYGNVVIPEYVTYNENSYKVTSIGNSAFYSCRGLTSVTIPNSVTSIGNSAFSGCISLSSITIPNSVTSIGSNSFRDCSALTSVTIPNSVISIESNAFQGCISLSSITIPNSVTSIGSNSFRDCSALSSVMIPNSVTSIGNSAFRGCISLSSIVFPNSVTSIGSSAFSGCTSLSSITIPNSVNIGSFAFYNTAWYINQPDGLIYLGKIVYEYKGTMPENTSISITEETVSIAGGAFYNCGGLSSIIIPNSVTSIGDRAFRDCISLSFITIPNSVTSISDETFQGCISLSSITIPNSVTSIGSNSFRDCSALSSVMIPNSVTSIGSSAFRGCISLSSIVFPNSVTSIESGAFFGCISLSSITIPNSLTSVGSSAFYNCSNLTSVHISDLEAWCKIIFANADSNPVFYAHKLLLNNEEIKDYKYPDNTTSINDYVFLGCSSLTSVTIPNSVTSIGDGAFNGCKLENVYTKNSSVQFEPSTFSGRTYQHAMLYIPEGTWGNAVYDSDWGAFNNIRELASKTEMLSPAVAYALIDVNSFGYAVYNEGNESVENVKAFYSIDDANPNNFWQIVNKEEGKCLYNIGAKKYLAVSADGQFSLTDVPVALKLSDTQDGITIDGNTRQWVFSKNYNVSVVNTFPKGDVNGDIKVGIGDIITVTNVMAGEGTEEVIKRADVNGDGEVGIGDIITITNIMAGE